MSAPFAETTQSNDTRKNSYMGPLSASQISGAIGWLTHGSKWQILNRRKNTVGLNTTANLEEEDINEEGTAWENNGGLGDLNN